MRIEEVVFIAFHQIVDAEFCSNGYVSKQNCRMYAKTPKHSEKVTAVLYRVSMITNFDVSQLNVINLKKPWVQQEGVTCHTARSSINL